MTAGRIGFLAIVVFWGTMNWLLWQAEFAGARTGGSPVSTEIVLDKLLTSPDPSTLEVRRAGQAMGYLHWYPDPGEEAQTTLSSQFVPEGMVRGTRGLLVRLEGNLTPPNAESRLHLDVVLRLDAGRAWEDLSLHATTREFRVAVDANQPRQELEWKVTQGNLALEHRVDLREASDPAKLLGEAAGPLAPLLAGAVAAWLPPGQDRQPALQWEARLDWMRMGSSKVRVYRLRGRWNDRYEANLLVNRAGEVLRIDLPGGWQLVNEGLSTF